jgi:hypothetical protein
LLPIALPWLGLLALLVLLPCNRSATAWGIWAPVVALVVLVAACRNGLTFMPSEIVGPMADALVSLGFGLATLWLAADWLRRTRRILTALCVWGTLTGASLFSFTVTQDWGQDFEQALPAAILLIVASFVLSTALGVTGWLCRKRRHFSLQVVSLSLSSLVTMAIVATPFALPAILMSGMAGMAWQVGASILIVTGVILATLVPFLALSVVTRIFGDRFRCLLHDAPPAAPPVVQDLALEPTQTPVHSHD